MHYSKAPYPIQAKINFGDFDSKILHTPEDFIMFKQILWKKYKLNGERIKTLENMDFIRVKQIDLENDMIDDIVKVYDNMIDDIIKMYELVEINPEFRRALKLFVTKSLILESPPLGWVYVDLKNLSLEDGPV